MPDSKLDDTIGDTLDAEREQKRVMEEQEFLSSPEVVRMMQENTEKGGGNVFVTYNKLRMIAPLHDILHAKAALEKCPPNDRGFVMASVRKSLDRIVKMVDAEIELNEEDTVNVARDLALWHVNEVLEGRASLSKPN